MKILNLKEIQKNKQIATRVYLGSKKEIYAQCSHCLLTSEIPKKSKGLGHIEWECIFCDAVNQRKL